MPQPVKLSDTLIEDARTASADADRSIAGQIEHWARIGRSVENVLANRELHALKHGVGRLARDLPNPSERVAVLQAITLALQADGHARLGAVLKSTGKTRYGTDPAFPGCVVQVQPDGTRTAGHLVNRRFIPLLESSPLNAARTRA